MSQAPSDHFAQTPEERAKGFLEYSGYIVTKIEEADALRSDYLVAGTRQKYLLEVKSRELSEKDAQGIRDHDLYVHDSKPLGYDDNVRRILRKAIKQLHATATIQPADFHVVWFDLVDRFGSYQNFERLFSTLYGIQRLFHAGGDVGVYYFTHSVFFKERDLDAVVVLYFAEGEFRLELLINNFANRYQQFIASELGQTFGTSYRDPARNHDSRMIFAETRIDRNDVPGMLTYLMTDHGLERPIPFDLDSHDITVTIKTE